MIAIAPALDLRDQLENAADILAFLTAIEHSLLETREAI